MKNIFTEDVSTEVINRIGKLDASSKPAWGKMDVAKMLAHCNVTYELVYDNSHSKPGMFKRFLLTQFVKKLVVGEKPFKRDSPTASEFLIKDNKDFDKEKSRLVDYIRKTQELGETYFDNRESHSFGNLSKTEWNNMFYKHLDHHLIQFGV
ncbi:DUF1569 domain-containing protein [Pedobacter cryoconitis]|uniref:DUF1569 domain-containing protein n=1 Tax=Pedobacter cryoconitis TaxID=188932 RepID=A0A7X0J7F7_9SPHI|nr:DUF1569 domain-containing protein [Pedobacter cryoconitis]MBB6502491.1 hypothetical protein [Pedobacter cryoconitis]